MIIISQWLKSAMSVISLIRSAFGHSCLYKALDASRSSTPDELKRAYRRSALRYHPDRANVTTKSDDAVVSSTLKFQAVSAAYQVLMNEKQRSMYDATGKILDDDNSIFNDCEHDRSPRKCQRRSAQNNDQWESFFYSIFHEIISAKETHAIDAKSYRGSSKEESDVIKYYNICKGDWDKVVDCVPHGDKSDIKRWKQYITSPALTRREVQDDNDSDDMKRSSMRKAVTLDDSLTSRKHSMTTNISDKGTARKQMSLDDSSSSEDEQQNCLPRKRRLQRLQPDSCSSKKGVIGSARKQISLDDSLSSEDEQQNCLPRKRRLQKKQLNSYNSKKLAHRTLSAQTSMSKRDKLEYRTAKKQKEKTRREIEVAQLFQSKDWSGTVSSEWVKKSRKTPTPLTRNVLDRIGKKYAKRTKTKTKSLR